MYFDHFNIVQLRQGRHKELFEALNNTRIVQISAGFNHSVALDSDGYVWTWGENRFGQLGDSTTIDRSVPKKVESPNILGTNGLELHGELLDDNQIDTYLFMPEVSGIYRISVEREQELYLIQDGVQISGNIQGLGRIVDYLYAGQPYSLVTQGDAGVYTIVISYVGERPPISGSELRFREYKLDDDDLANLHALYAEEDYYLIKDKGYLRHAYVVDSIESLDGYTSLLHSSMS